MQQVLIVHEDEIATVVGRGELDAFVAPELERAFGALVDVPHLLVDLSGVSFMDSTALGCVVRAARACEARGASVKIVLPTGTARRIFEITTLDRALPVADSRGSALAELSA
jgi:anti-sigma B factor antagonist